MLAADAATVAALERYREGLLGKEEPEESPSAVTEIGNAERSRLFALARHLPRADDPPRRVQARARQPAEPGGAQSRLRRRAGMRGAARSVDMLRGGAIPAEVGPVSSFVPRSPRRPRHARRQRPGLSSAEPHKKRRITRAARTVTCQWPCATAKSQLVPSAASQPSTAAARHGLRVPGLQVLRFAKSAQSWTNR